MICRRRGSPRGRHGVCLGETTEVHLTVGWPVDQCKYPGQGQATDEREPRAFHAFCHVSQVTRFRGIIFCGNLMFPLEEMRWPRCIVPCGFFCLDTVM